MQRKPFLAAGHECSYIRDADATDKADICTPVTPEAILTLTKMK